VKKIDGNKNLSLKTETVRALSADEMKDIGGGKWGSSCWTVTIPSAGQVGTIIAITVGACG
jgi:hypothetical protein